MSDSSDGSAVIKMVNSHGNTFVRPTFNGCEGTIFDFEDSNYNRVEDMVVNGVRAGDLASLEDALDRLGVPRSNIVNLADAVRSAPIKSRRDVAREWWKALVIDFTAGGLVTIAEANMPLVLSSLHHFLG